MAASQPEVRSMAARIAANSRWAREFHRKEATAAARRGFYRRFERAVDSDGVLEPEERERLALRSAEVRRRNGRSRRGRSSR